MIKENIDLILKIAPEIVTFVVLIRYFWVGLNHLPKLTTHFVNCNKIARRHYLKFFRNIPVTIISSKKNPYFHKNSLFKFNSDRDQYPGIEYVPEYRKVMVTKKRVSGAFEIWTGY